MCGMWCLPGCLHTICYTHSRCRFVCRCGPALDRPLPGRIGGELLLHRRLEHNDVQLAVDGRLETSSSPRWNASSMALAVGASYGSNWPPSMTDHSGWAAISWRG